VRLLRRLGWLSAFAALAKRAYTGVSKLDEPLPEEQRAEWPALAFKTHT